MLKYDVSKDKVIIDPTSLQLKELREVWDCDKTPTKARAADVLTYIHLTSQIDADAPFAGASYSDVRMLVIRNIWPDDKHRIPAIIRWLEVYYQADTRIKAYMEAFQTPDQRSEKIFDKKIDQLQELLDQTAPVIREQVSKTTGVASFVSNTSYITKIMTELSKLMDERDKLKARIKKRSGEDLQLFGSKTESILEKKHRGKH